MSAKIIPFEGFHWSDGLSSDSEVHFQASSLPTDSPAQLRAEVSRLERLDRDLQVQAHRINLSIGEVRRERRALLKRLAEYRLA